jgi:hypothetical protein
MGVLAAACRGKQGETKKFSASRTAASDCSNWDEGYQLGLPGEFDRGHRCPWTGKYYLVAIYGRALSASEVVNNFKAGLVDG